MLLAVTGVIAVFVWGGYDLGWQWTGLSSAVTLWDWLQVLALPVAVGIAPVLLRHRRHLTRRHRQVVASALIASAALVSAGYLVPLQWTGFTGNTLWDWLELALLPLVVATAALWADREVSAARTSWPVRSWRVPSRRSWPPDTWCRGPGPGFVGTRRGTGSNSCCSRCSYPQFSCRQRWNGSPADWHHPTRIPAADQAAP